MESGPSEIVEQSSIAVLYTHKLGLSRRRFMLPETVETQRLLLRRPFPKDADAIFHAYAQDKEVTRYLVWSPHSSVETTRNFVADCENRWKDAKAFPYVITQKSDRELLGMIEFRPNGHLADFGFVLARRYWGQGLMPEAASALVSIVLAQPAIYRVEATCDVDNKASARVLEKAGLSREGLLRRNIIHPNISAEPRDSFLYAITR
jgi:ribosomal-protein-alanine N-acetyltransferase